MIDLSKVGATASVPTAAGVDVHFGIYLPGIDPSDGFDIQVLVIWKRSSENAT